MAALLGRQDSLAIGEIAIDLLRRHPSLRWRRGRGSGKIPTEAEIRAVMERVK
jgi:hypothetical protein